MQTELLKKVQQKELLILKEVSRICEESSITYYLAYGTLLGAIRHKGFIPWDDDIDIILYRSDYDKLMSILPQKLPPNMWVQNYDTDSGYWEPYAKVRDLDSVYKEEQQKFIDDKKCGIWIDIFPVDACNRGVDTILKNVLLKTMGMSIRKRIFGSDWKLISKRYLPLVLIWNTVPLNVLKKWQEGFMKNTNNKLEYCAYLASYSMNFSSYIYPKKWLIPKKAVFEDHQFIISKCYDQMLECMYGNYMQLPPEEDRKGHSVFEIRL